MRFVELRNIHEPDKTEWNKSSCSLNDGENLSDWMTRHSKHRYLTQGWEYRINEGNPIKLNDMKAALNSGVKPDISHVRTPLLNYVARNCEYGNDKYERSNYIRSAGSRLADDFVRYRAYLRAAVSHAIRNLDAMERHQATDPTLSDEAGMKAACYAVDTDPSEKVGPSMLPHIGGTVASLNMALEQAVTAGLLPNDPGQPWKNKE